MSGWTTLVAVGRTGAVAAVLSCHAVFQVLSGVRGGERRSHRATRINRLWARPLMKALGVTVEVEGKVPSSGCIVVANHMGWIDPLALSSHVPLAWITSTDVLCHWLLGTVTRLSGCLFVSRRAATLLREMHTIACVARQGVAPAFFPEGTSSDGSEVLPFRPAFFGISAAEGLSIVPIALRWNDPRAAWYGDMTFFPHFWDIVSGKPLVLHAQVLAPIPPEPDLSRKQLAGLARERIVEALAHKGALLRAPAA